MDLVNVTKKSKFYASVKRIKFKQIVDVVLFVHKDANNNYLVGIFVNFSAINHLVLQDNVKKFAEKYVLVDMFAFKDAIHLLNV
jgi:hypothetical protein